MSGWMIAGLVVLGLVGLIALRALRRCADAKIHYELTQQLPTPEQYRQTAAVEYTDMVNPQSFPGHPGPMPESGTPRALSNAWTLLALTTVLQGIICGVDIWGLVHGQWQGALIVTALFLFCWWSIPVMWWKSILWIRWWSRYKAFTQKLNDDPDLRARFMGLQ